MNKNSSRLILEDKKNEFLYSKNKSNLNISFNRVAFIFFIFFIVSFIYSIHLIHLGSRKTTIQKTETDTVNKKLYRADIIDRNNKYLSKTISSIDIGISPKNIIDEKKLLLNLRYIFPNKDYSEVKKRIKKGNFFYFEKKFLMRIMRNL